MTRSGNPMLALVPGQAPGTGASTPLSCDLPHARGLHPASSAFDRAREGWLITRLVDGIETTIAASSLRHDAYDAWLSHVWSAAACSRPVLLKGTVRYADPATGEVTGTINTDDLPDKVIYKPCGNRRATSCPGCAEVYRRDAFQLVRAGLAGGKGVPESVASHPVVFATFTAPSFGPVHSRPVRRHTCASKQRCRCQAEPCHPRRDAGTCPHGHRLACYRRHNPGDEQVGQPLCLDCYDYPAHAVWNAAAGELWRRTKQDIERRLIAQALRLGYDWTPNGQPPVRLAHGKVAEYQARGAVHFHVLLRLDGTTDTDPTAPAPPPPGLTAGDLEDAVRQAGAVAFRTRPHPDSPAGEGWAVTWGHELDVRPVADTGPASVTRLAVASYLAKYATKSTEAAGHTSRRIDTVDALRLHADPYGTHTERLIHACWVIGHADGRMRGKVTYRSLRRWAHMLGFGGHFLTKAHRYSVTFGALRQARIDYRRHQETGPDYTFFDRQDELDEETSLVLTSLSFAGAGWHTFGDALLANTAADQARKRREVARAEAFSENAKETVSQAA